MNAIKTINVGLMGLGVVGGGVAAALQDQSNAIHSKAGLPIRLKKVLVRDGAKPRGATVSKDLLTTDPQDILADDDI